MLAADTLRLAAVYSFFYYGICQLVPTPLPTGLYFMVGDNIYLPGETVLLSTIGNSQIAGSSRCSAHSVVCVTANVNTACCRTRDGGNVGEWYHPDGTIVPRRSAQEFTIFSRSGSPQQVCLNYRLDADGPLGAYSCKVPDGKTGMTVSANITITDSYLKVTLTSQDIATAEGIFTFTCTTSVMQNLEEVIHYEWRGPNNNVITAATRSFTISTGVGGSMLSLSSVQPSHIGKYTCTVIGSLSQKSASKVLSVKLKAPALVLLTLPPPPIYIGSSHILSCHFQLTRPVKILANFHVEWTAPFLSTWSFTKVVSAIGRTSYTTNAILSTLVEFDRGNYTCSVYLASPIPYIIQSDVIQDTSRLDIQALPTISVVINESASPTPGHHHTLICLHSSSDENLQYLPSYLWRHNGNIIVRMTSKYLSFLFLTLSNAGNYTCEVSAISSPLGSPLMTTSEVHKLSLQIPSPSLMLTSVPHQVFAGSSPNLICSIQFTEAVDVSLIVEVKWMSPTRSYVERAVRAGSLFIYTSAFPLIDVADSDAGIYNCTVTTSDSDFLSAIPAIISSPFNLIVVGPPSTPTDFTATALATSIFLTWNQLPGDVVASYIISYTYIIKDCNKAGGDNILVGGDSRAHTLEGLEENTDFTFDISARNEVGTSGVAATTTITLAAAPSSGPTSLTVTSATSTSISISWGPVPCADRNAAITGYLVTHRPFLDITGASAVVGQSSRAFTATGLCPRTNHVLTVTPLYGSDARGLIEARLTGHTEVPEVLGFFLGGILYSNNTVLSARDIGEGNEALFCLTNFTDCCGNNDSTSGIGRGYWKVPDNFYLTPHTGPKVGLYSTGRDSAVLLNRDSSVKNPIGVYTCEVPDANGVYQNLYVYISQGFSGLRIDDLDYKRESLTLSCTSRGRTVNSVSWLKDDSVISKDSAIFSQSQVITDATSATYLHTLFNGNVTNFEGRFACIVNDASGKSVNRTLALNNCPAAYYGALTSAGAIVCIECPKNSISTSVGSTVCGCLQGYYRNPLEDPNFSCTRPPSACRNLRMLDNALAIFRGRMKWLQESTNAAPGATITLRWERPLITGRDDVYYHIYYSDPDFPDTFVRHSPYPLAWDSSLLQYRLSGLRPLTNYTVRVTVHNGVSEQDPGNDAERKCELTWTTPYGANRDIGAPRSVTAMCHIIVWQVPALADEKVLTGYDILFSTTSTNYTVTISKKRDQLFHLVKESDLPDTNQKEHTSVRVRAKIATMNGTWSDTVSLNCSPGNDITCTT